MQNWTEQNLLNLIRDGQEEHLELEFKAAGSLANNDRDKSEISKDVSAFANTTGGTILYGIREAPAPPHAATAIDPIDPSVIRKEWLEQVINSRIHRRIPNIFIDAISLVNTRPNHVVYRIVIPESDTVHQAYDNKYYKRFNFQSVPMEDHEVRQAMFRLKMPCYTLFPQVRTSGVVNGIEFHFSARVVNRSELTGHDCTIFAYAPSHLFQMVAEYDRVEILGEEYVRMQGHRGVDLSPGPTELAINRTFILQADQAEGDPFPISFRLYDAFGLALFEKFLFAPGTRTFTLQQVVEVGRKPATTLP